MTNEVSTQHFDYGQVDGTTADFLRQKETNMREIVGKAYTDLGRELKEAQDELAKHGYGCFEGWYKALGFKRQKVYRLIERYENLILPNWEERELLEDLPVSLTYEIAKPSADSTPAKAQAKSEVLAGDVSTLKEYRERIAELERAAADEQQARQKAEAERNQLGAELTKERAKEPEIRVETEYVTDETAEQELAKYRERFGDLSLYERSTNVNNVQDIAAKLLLFNKDVRQLLERYGYLERYKEDLSVLSGSYKDDFLRNIQALQGFCMQFSGIKKQSVDSEVIDAEEVV